MTTPHGPDRFLTIDESAWIIGGLCWLERHAFEVLGAWSTVEPDDRTALVFAEASLHHGWHGELWTERLPSARGFDAGELVAAPTVRALEVVGVLQALDDPAATAARVWVWFDRVLPALVDTYESLLAQVSPVADAPMRRALTLALDDDRREVEVGRDLLERVGPLDESGLADLAESIPPLDGGAWFVASSPEPG